MTMTFAAESRSRSFRAAHSIVLVLVLGIMSLGRVAAQGDSPQRGMVASSHPLATQAGLSVLKNGGNAIDAAVAVGLTLGVVETHNSGIGGGCFLLVRLANGKMIGIDGRETAPAAATRDLFVRNGKADTALSQTGALASGVPGELAAFDYALRKFGKKRLREILLPAAELAERGFQINSPYADRLADVAAEMKPFSPPQPSSSAPGNHCKRATC